MSHSGSLEEPCSTLHPQLEYSPVVGFFSDGDWEVKELFLATGRDKKREEASQHRSVILVPDCEDLSEPLKPSASHL